MEDPHSKLVLKFNPKDPLSTGQETKLEDFGVFSHYTSLQMLINYFIEKNTGHGETILTFDDFGDPGWNKGHDLYKTLFRAKAVFICEPGKLRPLTKGSSITYWTISPHVKFLQAVLAAVEEHQVGLFGEAIPAECACVSRNPIS